MAITASANEPAPRTRRPVVEAAVYVDDRALAARTSISRSKWQAMRYAKEGPPWYKLPGDGRRVFYKWAEVEAWLESEKVSPCEVSP